MNCTREAELAGDFLAASHQKSAQAGAAVIGMDGQGLEDDGINHPAALGLKQVGDGKDIADGLAALFRDQNDLGPNMGLYSLILGEKILFVNWSVKKVVAKTR